MRRAGLTPSDYKDGCHAWRSLAAAYLDQLYEDSCDIQDERGLDDAWRACGEVLERVKRRCDRRRDRTHSGQDRHRPCLRRADPRPTGPNAASSEDEVAMNREFIFLPRKLQMRTCWHHARATTFPLAQPRFAGPANRRPTRNHVSTRVSRNVSASSQLFGRPSALAAVAASLTHPARGRNAYIVHAVLQRSWRRSCCPRCLRQPPKPAAAPS